jgi:hypothetical protein
MARKRRASPSPPSPPPPAPTPPREESSSSDEEEAAPATQKAPQNPKPASTAASDADSSDGDEEESSDGEIGAEAYQLRQVARSPGKPSAAVSKPRSGTDSSDNPEPVQKKAARKPKAEADRKKKKRQPAESPPSGKAKKAKKAAPEPALPGKAKKKARADKASSEPNPSSSKGKKRKALAEPDVPDHSPSSKSRQRWTTEDEIKVLEALASHIKTNGTEPSAADLIAAVGDSLERKNCSKSDVHEKVRKLKRRHEAAAKKVASSGTLPGNEDELRKFNLAEAVWGERANKVAAVPVSQNDGASSKSKKGRTNKEKADGHSKPGGGTAKETASAVNENVGTVTGSSKGQATKEKVDGDMLKGSLSKKATTADTPVKSKKRGNHKEELKDHAKAGTTKETTSSAATQNGSTSVRSKSDNKEKRNRDAESLRPKEATAVTQNGGTIAQLKTGVTHEEKMDTDPNVKSMRKGFEELQNLYPNLTSYVESIRAQHPCGETLKRAFGFIAEDKACALESKIKKQRVAEMKMENRRADTKKEVTNMLIRLLD